MTYPENKTPDDNTAQAGISVRIQPDQFTQATLDMWNQALIENLERKLKTAKTENNWNTGLLLAFAAAALCASVMAYTRDNPADIKTRVDQETITLAVQNIKDAQTKTLTEKIKAARADNQTAITFNLGQSTIDLSAVESQTKDVISQQRIVNTAGLGFLSLVFSGLVFLSRHTHNEQIQLLEKSIAASRVRATIPSVK